MQKTLSSLLLFLSVSAVADAQDKVVFKGNVTGPWQGHTVFLYNNVTKTNDSSDIVDGKFEISVPFAHPTRHLFYSTYDTKVKRGYAPFGVLVDGPGTITIDLKIDDGFSASRVAGSKPHAIYAQFMESRRASARDSTGDLLYAVLKEHPESYATAFILERYGDNLAIGRQEEVWNALPPSLRESYEGRKAIDRINGIKNTEIGAYAVDFTLETDTDGQTRTRSSLNGKYVLLDFWASWCGPCIAEFPHLKETYGRFRDKGFEVLGVSIDKNRDRWLEAIKKHELPWPQVIDRPGDEAIALKKYAASVIPTTYLLDPDGKIIAKNLKSKALEEFLAEVLGD